MHLLLARGSGEWSALYKDGKLERVGDHYVVDEYLYELFDVEVEQTDDFMRGGEHREDVAKSLGELQEYRSQREDRKRTAASLREQAANLIRQAEGLERGD
jgi:hypothetical protein